MNQPLNVIITVAKSALAWHDACMAKRKKRPTDVNELARHLVNVSTGDDIGEPEDPSSFLSHYMATIGRKGGKIGGKRRLQTMTAQQRSANAKLAAKARWNRS